MKVMKHLKFDTQFHPINTSIKDDIYAIKLN